MDFFSAQDAARSSTTRLVILFLLAVVSLIALTNLLIMVFMGFFNADMTYLSTEHPTGLADFFAHFDWAHFFAVGAAVTFAIFLRTDSSLLIFSTKLNKESLGLSRKPKWKNWALVGALLIIMVGTVRSEDDPNPSA